MAKVISLLGNLVERLKGSAQDDFAQTVQKTPVDNLLEAVYAGDFAKVRNIVVANEGILDARNAQGETVLMRIGGMHKPEMMIGFLIDLGAQLDARDVNGRDVLGNAIAASNLDAATYYMNVKGCVPDFDDAAMLSAGRVASYEAHYDFGFAVAAKRPKI